MLLRAISGAVYVLIIVACILLGQNWFCAMTGAFLFLGIYEFHNLETVRSGEKLGMVQCGLDYLAAFTLWGLYLPLTLMSNSRLIMGAFLSVLLILIVAILCQAVISKSSKAYTNVSKSFLCLAYIALPLSLLNFAYTLSSPEKAMTIILLSLICIWINDTGAYLVGSRIGRRRLCERLSPKKSWEGFWGGFFLVVIAISVYALIQEKNIFVYALYGAVVSVLATFGDLFESLLKRTAGVKDSGKLIPGHGGLLDRIDSLLFVSYAIFLMSFIQ